MAGGWWLVSFISRFPTPHHVFSGLWLLQWGEQQGGRGERAGAMRPLNASAGETRRLSTTTPSICRLNPAEASDVQKSMHKYLANSIVRV